MTDPEKNLATVRRFWDAIGSGDVDAYQIGRAHV